MILFISLHPVLLFIFIPQYANKYTDDILNLNAKQKSTSITSMIIKEPSFRTYLYIISLSA